MDKSTKKLLSGSVVYFMGNALTQLVSLLLLRFVTSNITPSEYGFFNLVTTVSNLAVPFITLQIADAVFRFVVKSKNDEEKSAYFTVCYVISFISVGCIIAIVLGISIFASVPNTILVALYVATYALIGIYQKMLRAINRSDVFVTGNLIKTILFLSLEILLISVFGMGIEALLLAHIFSMAFFVLYAELRTHLYRFFEIRRFSRSTFTEMVRFSIPLIPNAAFWWMTSSVNHVIVSARMGMDVNGIYAISNKFSAVLVMLTSVLNMSWQDTAIAEYGSSDFPMFLTKTFNTFVKLIFSAVAVLIPLIFIVIPYMIDESYYSAIAYTPFLLVASGTSTLSGFVAQVFVGRGDTKKLFITSLAGMVANLLSVVILLDFFGLWAAVIGTLIADVLIICLRLAMAWREFEKGIEYGKYLVVFAILIVSCLLFLFASTIVNLAWLGITIIIAVILNYDFIKNIFSLIFSYFSKKKIEGGTG